jgi:hypothetical protein
MQRSSVYEVFEGEEGAFAEEGDDALVSIGLAVAGELVAGLGGDADAAGAAELEQGPHSRVSRGILFLGDADVVEWAGTSADGLFDRMQAV